MANVAIMGFGTVGSGVYEIIKNDAKLVKSNSNDESIVVKHILDIRDFSDHEDAHLFTDKFEDILNDDSISVVVEVMGGLHPAYEFTKELLLAGKSVVTSNKELVATYGTELLKIAFIITFAVHIELASDRLDKILNILFLCAHGAAATLLVVITGDMGSALVFLMIFAVMMFMAGIKLRYFAIAILTVVAAFPLVWVKVFNDIQRDRILALIYPESYSDIIYQQLQGKNAIGSGQFTGAGLFKGPYTQNGVVPEAENDMILSVFGEELGFIGCMFVMLLFLLMVFRVIKVAQMANDNPGKMMCIGVAAMIASQVIVNVGMCLMLLPCIGITLPFMSAGGSSTLSMCLLLGVVNHTPHLVTNINLLAEIMVKLLTDSLYEMCLHLQGGHFRQIEINKHMFWCRALKQQCQTLIRSHAERRDLFLREALEFPKAFFCLTFVEFMHDKPCR